MNDAQPHVPCTTTSPSEWWCMEDVQWTGRHRLACGLQCSLAVNAWRRLGVDMPLACCPWAFMCTSQHALLGATPGCVGAVQLKPKSKSIKKKSAASQPHQGCSTRRAHQSAVNYCSSSGAQMHKILRLDQPWHGCMTSENQLTKSSMPWPAHAGSDSCTAALSIPGWADCFESMYSRRTAT